MKLFFYAERVCGIVILLLGLCAPYLAQLNRVSRKAPEALHIGPWNTVLLVPDGSDITEPLIWCMTAPNPVGLVCHLPQGNYLAHEIHLENARFENNVNLTYNGSGGRGSYILASGHRPAQ